MLRFGANLSMLFGELEFLERFEAASRHGFAAVEFLFPYAYEKERLAETAVKARLPIALFNLPAGDWNAGDRGLTCDPSRSGEFQDGVALAIDYALTLGTKQLHCMAGLRPEGLDDATVRATYLRNLRFAASELGKHDLRLLVEVINPRDMPGFYLTSSRQAFELIRDADVPNVRFQFDAYHLRIVEGELASTLERHFAEIGHVQIADTPGRNEPGTGEIDYPSLFAKLESLGYDGYVGCEYRPKTTTAAGLGWMARYV